MATYTLTIDHTKVSANLTNFPVYVNLNDVISGITLPQAQSIRVYKADGTTELPREIVNEVEMHFKADSLSSISDTTFILDIDGTSSDYAASDTYGAQNVWSSDYIGVYHFGDGATLSLIDSTGSKNGGNIGGSASSGQVSGGVEFDGTSLMSINNSAIYIPTTNSTLTVNMWINPDIIGSANYANRAFTVFRSADSSALILGTNNTDKVFFYDGVAQHNIATVSTGSWFRESITYDGVKFGAYFNGVPVGSYTATLSVGYNGAAARINGGGFDGRVDEVRISSVARSAEWIATEYNNQSSASTFYSVGEKHPIITGAASITGISEITL